MATNDEMAVVSAGEPLCLRCGASVALPNDVVCDECRAILDGAVTDWQDDPALPLPAPSRRPAA